MPPNPYASPASAPGPLSPQAQLQVRTHQSRVRWLGYWNLACGVAGLLFTVFVGVVATEVNPLWLLFWLARSLAGIGMIKLRLWGRWLGVLVHVLLCLSGVASVVGGFGLWVLLSDGGLQVFGPRAELPPLQPKHHSGFVALLAFLVLLNWAVPLWILVFVLGPMV